MHRDSSFKWQKDNNMKQNAEHLWTHVTRRSARGRAPVKGNIRETLNVSSTLLAAGHAVQLNRQTGREGGRRKHPEEQIWRANFGRNPSSARQSRLDHTYSTQWLSRDGWGNRWKERWGRNRTGVPADNWGENWVMRNHLISFWHLWLTTQCGTSLLCHNNVQ